MIKRKWLILIGIGLGVGVIMGIFSLLKRTDVNVGVQKYNQTPGSVLIDVRTAEGYAEGHIPGSINISLQQIEDVKMQIPDNDTPLFVYCRSGARSRRAASWLKDAGYTNVTDVGGIMNYSGTLER